MSAPVNIQQGTVNFSQIFSDEEPAQCLLAIQQDAARRAVSATDGNSFTNMGDQRNGRRQLFSLNDNWVITPTLVNEARFGGNRIHIVFNPDNTDNPATFGINSGVSGPVGLRRSRFRAAFDVRRQQWLSRRAAATPRPFLSDTLSWVHGNHTIKFGRRGTPRATPTISRLLRARLRSPASLRFWPIRQPDLPRRLPTGPIAPTQNALGFFVTDSWKATRGLTLTLGLRYDWYGHPREAGGRYVVFDPTTVSLVPRRQPGGPSEVYNQSAKNFQPRVGFALRSVRKRQDADSWSVCHHDRPARLWSRYRPPGKPALRVSGFVHADHRRSLRDFGNAYALAGGSVAPDFSRANYKDAYVQQWNLGLEQQLGNDFNFTARYVGSKGTDLNIERNYNQLD